MHTHLTKHVYSFEDIFKLYIVNKERGEPRGVGTLKFSVYIGEADFFGVKILNFRIFWGFQKN